MGAASAVTIVHIAAGTVALLVAPAALLARKGGAWHRRSGAAFMYAMAGVTVTAAAMWQAKGHAFLLFLDVVSLYFVISGYRVLIRRRRDVRDLRADAVDAAAAFAALGSGGALATLGAVATTPLLRGLAIVLLGLGAIGAIFAALELFALGFGAKTRFGWLFYHLSSMLAAYISAVTAFVVINAHGVPMLERWLVPVSLGTTLIVGFSAKYRLRFWRARRKAPRRPEKFWSTIRGANGEIQAGVSRSRSVASTTRSSTAVDRI